MRARLLGPLAFLACTTASLDTPTTDVTDDTASPQSTAMTGDTGATIAEPVVTDPLHGLATGADQWAALCARDHDDPVSNRFCEGDTPPTITSFAQLRTFVGLGGDEVGNGDPVRVAATRRAPSARWFKPTETP